MGEEELRRYVNKRKDFGTPVELKFLMKNSYEESGQPPFLIIDGLSYFRCNYPNINHWVYSVQWKHCVRELKACVQNLVKKLEFHSPLRNRNIKDQTQQHSGEVKLVEILFYFNGSIEERISQDGAKKYSVHRSNVNKAFSELKTGVLSEKQTTHLLPLEILDYIHYMLKYECKCNVHCYLENTHQQVAKLAKENSACFGILSEDCEYLIYNTKKLLFTSTLNVSNMTVKSYSNSELASATKLTTNQLKLLSCAIGNRIVPSRLLNKFHEKISPNLHRGQYTLVHKVANCIKEREWRGDSNELSKVAPLLGVTTDLLSKAINYYDFQGLNGGKSSEESACGVMEILRSRCFECSLPVDIYTVLNHKKYAEDLLLEEPTENSSSITFRPMRQRMYYVLFEGKQERVEEFCGYRNFFEEGPEVVDGIAVRVKRNVPPLSDLWSGQTPKELRWKLFVLCLEVNIPISELQEIEPRFIILCCLLNYLHNVQGVNLKKWEIKAFICQALHPLRELDFFQTYKMETPTPRAVSLASTFLCGVKNMLNILGTCGLPFPLEEAMPWKYFDGKLFHHIYRNLDYNHDPDSAIKKLFSNDESLFRQFKKLYQIITEEM